MPSCTIVTNPTFLPKRSIISSITQASVPTVTTSADHQLTTNQLVRFFIPRLFGMTQLNNLIGTITVTGNTTFTVDIDTSAFDSFVVLGVPDDVQCAQVVPIAEVNSTLSAATNNVLG